jgi:hypothetical protein
MPRRRIPEHLLTHEQLKRRARNERYRSSNRKDSDFSPSLSDEVSSKNRASREITASVTYKTIEQACYKLTEQNENLSIRSIRNHIGYGSLTTISKYLREWKRLNGVTAGKSTATARARLAKKRRVVTPSVTHKLKLVANGDDTFPGTAGVSNVIEFPLQSHDVSHDFTVTRSSVAIDRGEALKAQNKTLGAMWRECFKATFTPEHLSYVVGWTFQIFAIVALIIGFIWLSVHISGEFFGSKGFETVLGLLLGGGILSLVARLSKSAPRAFFFRSLAYLGTFAFLLVAFSGIKDTAVKESDAYIASKQKILALEEQITVVANTIVKLPPDFSTVRSREYARQDALQKELDAERTHLAQIKPSTASDFSMYGHFIVRFVLDVLVFALFEVLAGLMLRRRED